MLEEDTSLGDGTSKSLAPLNIRKPVQNILESKLSDGDTHICTHRVTTKHRQAP